MLKNQKQNTVPKKRHHPVHLFTALLCSSETRLILCGIRGATYKANSCRRYMQATAMKWQELQEGDMICRRKVKCQTIPNHSTIGTQHCQPHHCIKRLHYIHVLTGHICSV